MINLMFTYKDYTVSLYYSQILSSYVLLANNKSNLSSYRFESVNRAEIFHYLDVVLASIDLLL